MKQVLTIFSILLLALTGCTAPQAAPLEAPVTDGVQVFYFHGKQRCATCNAIEQRAAEVVNSLSDSTVAYTVVDLSTTEGTAVAANFEVASSALVLCQWSDGQLVRHVDLTNMAFASARSNQQQFKQSLADEIRKLKP